VGHDIDCKILCTKRVLAEDAALARDFIANEYNVEWSVLLLGCAQLGCFTLRVYDTLILYWYVM